MKKLLSVFTALSLTAGCITACSTNNAPAADNKNLQIVTTIFPEYDWVILPSEADGNSALPVGDRYEGISDLNSFRFAQLGGSWSRGNAAGGFEYLCTSGLSGHRKATIGGRLLYIPTAVV